MMLLGCKHKSTCCRHRRAREVEKGCRVKFVQLIDSVKLIGKYFFVLQSIGVNREEVVGNLTTKVQ